MSQQLAKLEHAPNLNTILMVENVLRASDKSIVKISELKKKLPKQVNHYTLMAIIDYLQQSNKIYLGTKGITWIFNEDPRMKEALKKAIPH